MALTTEDKKFIDNLNMTLEFYEYVTNGTTSTKPPSRKEYDELTVTRCPVCGGFNVSQKGQTFTVGQSGRKPNKLWFVCHSCFKYFSVKVR